MELRHLVTTDGAPFVREIGVPSEFRSKSRSSSNHRWHSVCKRNRNSVGIPIFLTDHSEKIYYTLRNSSAVGTVGIPKILEIGIPQAKFGTPNLAIFRFFF